jgi:hypothetical protein
VQTQYYTERPFNRRKKILLRNFIAFISRKSSLGNAVLHKKSACNVPAKQAGLTIANSFAPLIARQPSAKGRTNEECRLSQTIGYNSSAILTKSTNG